MTAAGHLRMAVCALRTACGEETPMNPAPLRVLIVDDDPDTRGNLCDILELDDYQVQTAGSVAEALNRKDWDRLAAILLDRRLRDGTAEHLLPRQHEGAPDAAVLSVTGYSDLQGAIA